jgi:magnesium-transporting ATPase (P-type)
LPGDLYVPDREIPCDSIVVARDLFVNEVGFTGENIPVGKFELADQTKVFEGQHWVYEGSAVVSLKEGTLLLAINTGFSSRRGRILRKIQINKKTFPEIFKNVIWLAA